MNDPRQSIIQEQERQARYELDKLLRIEESMHKQRARELAVNLGDSNTKYFYRLVKKRQSQAYISQITDADNNVYTDPSGIAVVFISHFQNILGPEMQCQSPDLSQVLPHGIVNEEDTISLMRPVTNPESEDVIKTANPNKAPGPDGFNTHFFQSVMDNHRQRCLC